MSEIPVNEPEETKEQGDGVFAEVLGASTVRSATGVYFPVEGDPFKPVRVVDHPGLDRGLDGSQHPDFIDRVPSFKDETGEDES